MRLLTYCLVSIAVLLPALLVSAQDVPLEKVDRDTYTFSTTDLPLITDFIIEGPSYHITDDPYQFKIIAQTEDGKPATTINSSFPFTINGQQASVQFKNGEALVELYLGKAKELRVQLTGTNVEQTQSITRMPKWPALAGLGLFLLLTWVFRHALARAWRKLTGNNKQPKA